MTTDQQIRGALTAEQHRQWEDQGYVLLRGLLPARSLEAVRQIFEETVDRQAKEWYAQGRITDMCEGLPFSQRYTALREQLPPTFSNSWRRIIVSKPIYDLWQKPEVIAVLRGLLGDELYAHGIWNGRPRPPKQTVMTIDWHQDAHYYADYKPEEGTLVTAWIPLVPVDEASGCLEVIPGSHKRGYVPPIRVLRNNLIGVPDDIVEGLPSVACPMQPGDVLLFDALTLHHSLDNAADYIRWSVDIRFCSAANSVLVAKGGQGYYCFSAADPSRVESYETWAAKYTHEGEF